MDKTILEMHAAELISNLLQLGLKNIFLLTFFPMDPVINDH